MGDTKERQHLFQPWWWVVMGWELGVGVGWCGVVCVCGVVVVVAGGGEGGREG